MSSRFIMLSVAGAAAAAVLVLPPRAAADQVSQVGTPGATATPGPQASEPEHRCASDDPALFWRCAQERATAFDPPRTANGRPDFSGYWRHGTEAKEDLEEPWDNRARVGASREPERDAGPGKSLIVDPGDRKASAAALGGSPEKRERSQVHRPEHALLPVWRAALYV
jgi:hypothetical protein